MHTAEPPERLRATAVVIRSGTVLMVEILDPHRRFWTLPGGGIDPGEDPATAAIRELEEETGLVGIIGDLLLRCDAPSPHWFFHVHVGADAVARVGHDPELAADAQEIVAVAWRPLLLLADDRQIALLNDALGARWWDALLS